MMFIVVNTLFHETSVDIRDTVAIVGVQTNMHIYIYIYIHMYIYYLAESHLITAWSYNYLKVDRLWDSRAYSQESDDFLKLS